MHIGVVPEHHHLDMKRKVLEAELLAARKVELDAADAKQKKKILKEIEKEIHEKFKGERIHGISSFIIH